MKDHDEGKQPFLSHYTMCQLPSRAFTQYVSKVVGLTKGSKKGSKVVVAKQQIDRCYVLAFEGDNVFNSILSNVPKEAKPKSGKGRGRATAVGNKRSRSAVATKVEDIQSSDDDTETLEVVPNCRVACLMPHDSSTVAPLRMIITSTQIFPTQALICCPQSIERCADEIYWAASEWAGLEKELEHVAHGSGSYSNAPPTAAAIRKKESILRAYTPVGPHWPTTVPYYHGIGEVHRDKGVGIKKEGTSELSFPPAQVTYPYNLLKLQPCKALGAGQLEVIAAAPIAAYTCFAYTGPVCDRTSVNTKESPYFLTLKSTSTVLGQGVTRYFNHRFRSDLFGNAQFSSVSVPIRPGMVAEAKEKFELEEEIKVEGDSASEDSDVIEVPSTAKSVVPKKGPAAKKSKQVRKGKVKEGPPTPPPSSPSSSTSAIDLMSLPFFITTRDISIGEPLLATSYGTAYDAQLEYEVFGFDPQQKPTNVEDIEKGIEKKKATSPIGHGSHTKRIPLPLYLSPWDCLGEFRWNIKVGDIVARILSAEEKAFFNVSDGDGCGPLFVVRDIDAEANVFLIAPLWLRQSGTSLRRPPSSPNVPISKEYLIPSLTDDGFRAIVHFATLVPLTDEDHYTPTCIKGEVVSVKLNASVAQVIESYPTHTEGFAVKPPFEFNNSFNSATDSALDGCLWPLYTGHSADVVPVIAPERE